MRHIPPSLWALLALATITAGCGKPLGPALSIKEHGFRATVHVTTPSGQKQFDFATRGDNRRFEGLSDPSSLLIVRGGEAKAYELDQKSSTYREVSPGTAPKDLDDHPLFPGFDEKAEAARRNLDTYTRESDTVFAGNACQLWRFDDRPSDPQSPSTTYWIAPSLDRIVVRVDRDTYLPDGNIQRKTTEFRNVRRGADPSLFEVPKSYKKAS